MGSSQIQSQHQSRQQSLKMKSFVLRTTAVAFALCGLVSAIEQEEQQACDQEVEAKVGELVEGKYGGMMSKIAKAHDADGDGHMQLADLEGIFREAGVGEACLPSAQESLAHLQTHHDHDNNGKLRHDELDKWRDADEF